MKIWRSAVVMGFFLFISIPSAHADIIWAFVGPMTGGAANYGLMSLIGTQQAIDDINAKGGVNGEKIVLKNYDDACDPKQAVAVANRIIAENIRFVIQGDCSGSSLAAEKTYAEENILVINTLATNPQLTDDGNPLLFRVLYRDDRAAEVLAQMILKQFKDKKIAIVHDKSAYGFGIAKGVQVDLNAAHVKEVFFDSYDPSSRDYSSLVTRLKQNEIDLLFVGGFPVDIATFARQIRENGLSKLQIVAGDLSDPDYWKIAEGAAEGSIFVFPPDPMKNATAQVLRKEFEDKHHVYNGLTMYGYAAAQILADAIRQSSSADPGKIAQFIHEKSFDTVLGKWHFDKKGDAANFPLMLDMWHKGKYEEINQ